MNVRSLVIMAGLLSLAGMGWGASPADAQAGGAGQESFVVLDTAGFWRLHHTFRQPVMQCEDGLVVIPRYDANIKGAWQIGQLKTWHSNLLAKPSPDPSAGWTRAEFDDSSWIRGTACRAVRSPYLYRLALRGKFTVTEAARVKDLVLEVGYHGGAIVYLNGEEIARQDRTPDAGLATPYPTEAFVDEAGKLIKTRGDAPLWKPTPTAQTAARIDARVRTLRVPLPATGLRPGANVLAVELIRAPYHKIVEEQLAISTNHGNHKTYDLTWNTCEIKRVRLTASAADGLVSAAVRPAGFQIWNSDPLATDYDLDFGDPAEKAELVRLVGARNGFYSGKVVVGSDKPILNPSATAGDLKGPEGTIAAAEVRIRYGMPWGDVALTNPGCGELLPYPAEPTPLVALLDGPPNEIPVYQKPITPRCMALGGQPAPVFGAVLPIWVTVKVPGDARPGVYEGPITIRAEGMPATSIPLQVKILDYCLPDPSQWRTWVELIQSPDTLATEYGVARWSDRHWEMIAKSMSYLKAVDSRVLFAPLIAKSNVGNDESMVRWIRKGENQYDYDFSILEKYLDVAEKQIGKPEVVIFNVWDRYLTRKESGGRTFQVEKGLRASKAGPVVTLLESAGKTEEVCLRDYTEAGATEMWKPLFDQLRQRMKKRGLEGAMQLGMFSDFWATKEQSAALKEISGGLPWASASHYFRKSPYEGLVAFGYQSSYFGAMFGMTKSLSGWKNDNPHVLFERVPLDGYPLAKWRLLAEQSVTGNVRGVGRLGADAWPVVKDNSGRRVARVWERWPGSNWGYLNADCSVLAPGPEGPVATAQFEALREGIQECEALIALEASAMAKDAAERLGPELAGRCADALNHRRESLWRSFALYQSGPDYNHEATSWRERTGLTGYLWFLASDWQGRSERLYTLAAEVQKAIAAQ